MSMKINRDSLVLYAVTDRHWLNGKTLKSQVREALEGGVTFVQLREKNLSGEELWKESLEIKEICREYHVPFVLDDNVALAKEIDADGVHLGQKDMEAGEARRILGPDKIIGVSARTVEQALLAEKRGASYLGVGAAFSTNSKSDAVVVDHETIKSICEAVSIPVIAIGGITKDNVKELSGLGLCGVAVISAVFGEKDIKDAAKVLKKNIKNSLTL